MQDIKLFYKVRNTVLEMLKDRGYFVDKYKVNFRSYKKLFIEEQDDIHVKNDNNYIYVKCLNINKIRSQAIKDNIKQIYTNHIGENDKIIFVLKNKPTPTIVNLISDNIQIFWIKELLVNITKHKYVPKHILLNKEQIKSVMEKYHIDNVNKLHIIYKTDPVAKYYGAKKGDVFKIVRPSETGGEYISYRCVK